MKLVVSAGENKIIQLPENSVTIEAYTIPREQEGKLVRLVCG